MKSITCASIAHLLSVLTVALSFATPALAELTPETEVPTEVARPVDASGSEVTAASTIPSTLTVAAQSEKKKKKKGKRAEDAANNGDGDFVWGDPWGDSQDEIRAAGFSFRFLLQAHYRQTFAYRSKNSDLSYRSAEEILVRHNDGWSVNRLFFRIKADPTRYLSLKVLLDMAELQKKDLSQSVKQAFAELKVIPKHLHVQAGVLKLPYSIMELDPVSDYEFTKMGEADDLVKRLGYAGRDVGAEVRIAPFSKTRYFNFAVGAFRGNAKDENALIVGAVGARVESEAIRGLRLGFDWVNFPKTHTYLNPFATASSTVLPNPGNADYPSSRTSLHGQAFSADITYHSRGLMLRTEGLLGTRVDYDTRYGASKFAAIWGIAAFRFPMGPVQLQPALRAEWLDSDYNHAAGLRRQLTAGVATYFTKSTRLLLDITRTDVQTGSPVLNQPEPLQLIPYGALSNTCATVQVQVAL